MTNLKTILMCLQKRVAINNNKFLILSLLFIFTFHNNSNCHPSKTPELPGELFTKSSKPEGVQVESGKHGLDYDYMQTHFKNDQNDAQDTGLIYMIKLKNGSTLYGNIIKQDSTEIVLKLKDVGIITIPMHEIKQITEPTQAMFKPDKYWFPNPNPSRYFAGPSGFQLKKGEAFYQNTVFIVNTINYGITDNFSIGGGIELLSLFVSITRQEISPIFIISPKAGIKVGKKINISAGITAGGMSVQNRFNILGASHLVVTYGTPDQNISAGTGMLLLNNEINKKPLISFSGFQRISKNFALLTENYIFPSGETMRSSENRYERLTTYGMRFFGQKLNADLGIIHSPSTGFKIGQPILFITFGLKF